MSRDGTPPRLICLGNGLNQGFGGATRDMLVILTLGSSIWPFIGHSPLVADTGEARIFWTTSIPCVTCPKTAKPSASPPGAPAS